VIVHDPTTARVGYGMNGWPQGAYVVADFPTFRDTFWASSNCLAIIDEAGDPTDFDPRELKGMLRRGRHRGHTCVLIAQRYADVVKGARDQCNALYAFTCFQTDAERYLVAEWNDPALAEVPNLPQLEYLYKPRHAPVQRGRIIF